MIKIIHNVETNEILEIEMTAKEIAEVKAEAKLLEAAVKAQEAKAEAKAALLEKLGISADEAALLLG